MRTKTLLLTAAVAAIGVASSIAQVYSINIVGYANVTCKGGALFTLVANPLDNGTNSLTSLVGGLPAKSVAQLWNGSSFNPITKGAAWDTTVVPVGTGFFVKNGIASSPDYTNTFVGSVVPNPGNSVTSSLPAGLLQLLGSKLPAAGNLNDTGSGTLNLTPTLPNKSVIQLWSVNAQNFADTVGGGGYPGGGVITKGAAGFSPNQTMFVGRGFFLKNNAATNANWVQTLP